MDPLHDFDLIDFVILDPDTSEIRQTGTTQRVVFESLRRQGLNIHRADMTPDTQQVEMDFQEGGS